MHCELGDNRHGLFWVDISTRKWYNNLSCYDEALTEVRKSNLVSASHTRW
jgi:hypothetical protein